MALFSIVGHGSWVVKKCVGRGQFCW